MPDFVPLFLVEFKQPIELHRLQRPCSIFSLVLSLFSIAHFNPHFLVPTTCTMAFFEFLVACTRLYTPLCPSVGRLVCQSHFPFFMIFIFGPHCSYPNGLVTSNMAPAHPHATWVAVYPALFLVNFVCLE